MLRRKRNRHSSPSVRPTTLAPPVHHLALKFLKMPYISSDLGPIIVFSHWMTLFCCLFKLEWFDLADEDWCLIARWYPSHNCDTSSPHFFNLSGRESASKSINRHLNIATGRLATTCATMCNTIVSSNTVSLHTSRQEHQYPPLDWKRASDTRCKTKEAQWTAVWIVSNLNTRLYGKYQLRQEIICNLLHQRGLNIESHYWQSIKIILKPQT